jgi:Dehydratase family
LTCIPLRAGPPAHRWVFLGWHAWACIGRISPEAAAGCPIAALVDGDMINIDLDEYGIDVQLTPAQIEQRLALVRKPPLRVRSSWLRRYAALVTSAHTGAVLAENRRRQYSNARDRSKDDFRPCAVTVFAMRDRIDSPVEEEYACFIRKAGYRR